MKKYTFNIIKIAFLILVFSGLNSCTENVKFEETATCSDSELVFSTTHTKADRIQSVMDSYINKGVPGISLLISDNEGLWASSAGYADLGKGVKMQTCHINKLGSITKMMVGAVVWQLIQEGTLKIDEPISSYIPDVAKKITNGESITLKMLLNHTSGIFDIGTSLGYNLAVINDFSRSWSSEEILEFVENKPATAAPGESVSYSNTNTMLESLIIEKITGKKTSKHLQDRIFTPLEMTQTVYYDFSFPFPYENLAQGYLDINNDGGSIQNISALNPGSGNGYTGVYSTVADLYRFMDALLRKKELISPKNLDYIFANMSETKSKEWKTSPAGIHQEFIEVTGEDVKAYGHAGGDIGYSANLNYFPHNNTIFAVSFNYGTNLPTELGRTIHELRSELIAIMAE